MDNRGQGEAYRSAFIGSSDGDGTGEYETVGLDGGHMERRRIEKGKQPMSYDEKKVERSHDINRDKLSLGGMERAHLLNDAVIHADKNGGLLPSREVIKEKFTVGSMFYKLKRKFLFKSVMKYDCAKSNLSRVENIISCIAEKMHEQAKMKGSSYDYDIDPIEMGFTENELSEMLEKIVEEEEKKEEEEYKDRRDGLKGLSACIMAMSTATMWAFQAGRDPFNSVLDGIDLTAFFYALVVLLFSYARKKTGKKTFITNVAGLGAIGFALACAVTARALWGKQKAKLKA